MSFLSQISFAVYDALARGLNYRFIPQDTVLISISYIIEPAQSILTMEYRV